MIPLNLKGGSESTNQESHIPNKKGAQKEETYQLGARYDLTTRLPIMKSCLKGKSQQG